MSMTPTADLAPPPRPSRTDDGRLVPLSQNHQIAASTFHTWVVTVPRQYTIADLAEPALWRQVEVGVRERAGRPKPGDLIRCTAEDGSYDAFYVIREVNRGYRLIYSHGRLPAQGQPS